jgi:hypothetical protein
LLIFKADETEKQKLNTLFKFSSRKKETLKNPFLSKKEIRKERKKTFPK